MKTPAILYLLVTIVSLHLTACTREGSRDQIAAFNEAVALEAKTMSLPDKQAAYMKVVAMAPDTKYGKAAASRVEQLNRQIESIMRMRP